jgi:ATP-dependent DNA helicase RecG
LCILVAPKNLAGDGLERLETMVRTSSGFEIAEVDLKLRGPGEFFGTRQHGVMGFSVANPLRDREFLELARRDAFALVEDKETPGALEKLLAQLEPAWRRRYQLAHVG